MASVRENALVPGQHVEGAVAVLNGATFT